MNAGIVRPPRFGVAHHTLSLPPLDPARDGPELVEGPKGGLGLRPAFSALRSGLALSPSADARGSLSAVEGSKARQRRIEAGAVEEQRQPARCS
jgi:hypothetical protein